MDNQERNAGVLFAFLLGAIAGGVAGALLAPSSGTKTRQGLAKWLKNWLEEGGDILSDGKEALAEQAKRVSAAAHAAKKAYES